LESGESPRQTVELIIIYIERFCQEYFTAFYKFLCHILYPNKVKPKQKPPHFEINSKLGRFYYFASIPKISNLSANYLYR